jgi:hypothetical protein
LAGHVEGSRFVDRVPFHEDSLLALRDGATPESAFEVVVLGKRRRTMSIEFCQSVGSASVM